MSNERKKRSKKDRVWNVNNIDVLCPSIDESEMRFEC